MMFFVITMSVLQRQQEYDDDDKEYKFQLLNLTDAQKQHLACQMQFRLEGGSEYGQVIYDIGLTDDGFPLGLSEEHLDNSIASLRDIVSMLPDCTICAIERHEVIHYAESLEDLYDKFLLNRKTTEGTGVERKWKLSREGKERGLLPFKRYVAECIIRKSVGQYWETKIGIAGNVDCGKSSLLGVLVSGQYDNGRGKARITIMKHKHEQETGRTSSVSQEIVGFNTAGELVNEKLAGKTPGRTGERIEWSSIVRNSSKIITFFDLAGHLDYLSQTITGITSNELDYVIVVVGANMSSSVDKDQGKEKWINMTREHMDICLGLNIPCIVVVTKIDATDPQVRKETVGHIQKLLKSKFAPYKLDSIDEVRTCVDLMSTGRVIPIVQLSNVTGEGMDVLKKLLHYLPPRKQYLIKEGDVPVLQIQEIFRQVEGTSLIIAGMLTSGTLQVGEDGKAATNLKIGPFSDGSFFETRVRSLQVKKMDVGSVTAGRYVCIGLPRAAMDKGGKLIRKGMFAVGAKMHPQAVWEFWADIRLARYKSSCIRTGYTPLCHIAHIKQTCKILRIVEQPKEGTQFNADTCTDKVALAAGDDARVLMRFCFRPELIFEDDKKRLIFREGKTKGIGTIVEVTSNVHLPIDNKTVTKDAKTRPSRRERRALREQSALSRPGGPRRAAPSDIVSNTMQM
jgi:GTPase